MAGIKLTPFLLKNLSVSGFTNFTNLTNFIAFSLRGPAEIPLLYFGMLPFMLPGVNGASAAALTSVVNDHLTAAGFGIGESSAWLNNLRVLLGVVATLLYGYFYSWCRKKGINPGQTYVAAAILGAALPQ